MRRKILHVDDDVQVTRLVAKLLTDRGYEVTSLNDSTQAMEEVVRGRHQLVLLDIDMPAMDGMQLLRLIKGFDGGTQVIMLTGIVTMSTALQSLRWGAEACFFKPLADVKPLLEAVELTFDKIDRWWKTLEDLTHRRRQEAEPVAVG